MDVGSGNLIGLLVPFLGAIAISSIVFFALRAINRKKHPTEDDIEETKRQRREREKLKRQTMEKVTSKMQSKKDADEESHTNGLRSGKYKKKKKK